jgi:addiction module HigA family antidote
MAINVLPPIHPGEVLKEEFLLPLKLSINRLARDLHVAPNRISHIVNGSRSITADTALRLAAFFGTSPEFWMNLQALYDLELARARKASEIKKQVRRFKYPSTSAIAEPTKSQISI